MNTIDLVYQDLLQAILDNGVDKETRNGNTEKMCTAMFTFVAMKEGKPFPHGLSFSKFN